MGKGSTRRPQQIPDAEVQSNWAKIFGKPEPAVEQCNHQWDWCGKRMAGYNICLKCHAMEKIK